MYLKEGDKRKKYLHIISDPLCYLRKKEKKKIGDISVLLMLLFLNSYFFIFLMWSHNLKYTYQNIAYNENLTKYTLRYKDIGN